LATESSPAAVHYLTYPEAVTLHVMLMRRLGETYFGVFDRTLIEADRWDFNAITAWYRQRTFPLSPQLSQ